jgi:hypothetical protein
MGADCGASSRVYQVFKDGSVELTVSMSLSPEEHADAYAQSQAVEEALRSRDPEAIKLQLEKLVR